MTVDTVPLRHAALVLVSNVDKKSSDGDPGVWLVNYTDVYYNGEITIDMSFMEATATPEQVRKFRVMPGDSIITKDSETPDDIGVPAYVASATPDMVCGYHLAILRPRDGLHGKFLYWALASNETREQLSVSANGMTRYGLTYEAIQSARIHVPEVNEQRRIADFLDDQTARIDRIIAARRDQAALIEAALRSEAAHHYDKEPRIPLRHLVAEARVGIVVRPSDYYTEGENGVPALRGIDVQPFEVSGGDLVKITPEGDALNARSRLRADDVVLVRTGDAGAASRVPSWAAGYNAIDLVILRAGPSASPDYLEFVINAARWGAHIDAAAAGSIQQHFGVNAALALRVPFLDKQDQARIAADFAAFRALALEGQRALHNSIDLLQEFKGSLISAAVSGEFDVSSASGRGVSA